MTKTRNPSDANASKKPAGDDKASPAPDAAAKHKDSARDTIESIVVAFILAFLFRTFEAEAFVIPTGSMAPTLVGRHKDVVCPQCGCQFQIGASEEVDKLNEGEYHPGHRIRHAACPNCRYVVDVFNLPVFKGDRILVNKFAYELGEPQRWDVAVFKYPEDPKTNYIKRLIGLPNETLEIRQGDVYKLGEAGAEILRKEDPGKQRELQILVYDNDHPEQALLDHGWPERWTGMKKDQGPDAVAGWSPDPDGWQTDAGQRSLRLDASEAKDALRWMRYRHIVPQIEDWGAVTGDPPREPRRHPQPRLVTDFCGYNATHDGYGEVEDGQYWVGDLTLSCKVDVENATEAGTLLFELVEGSRRYRCRFDLSTGRAELRMLDDLNREDDEGSLVAAAVTRVKGTGSWRIAFANVDDRLCLWVDDRLIDFGKSTEYQPFGGLKIQTPWDEDLVPVGIAARGATVRVSKLLLERDIYYRGEYVRASNAANPEAMHELVGLSEYELQRESWSRLSDPEAWGKLYTEHWIGNDPRFSPSDYQFTMSEDEFFMLGDNSPKSADSRLWPKAFRNRPGHRHAVQRSALVGKAFFIYWPHGVPFGNDGRGWPDGKDSVFNNSLTRGWFYHKAATYNRETGQFEGLQVPENDFYPSFRVPFYPNVARMQRIR